MTIDKKAREPLVDSLPIKFVFSSGDALSQGVVTLGLIEDIQIRVCSPTKTVADCFKYADKIGVEVGPAPLAAAENAKRLPEPARSAEEVDEVSSPARVWDREVLQKQVWPDQSDSWQRNTACPTLPFTNTASRWASCFPGETIGQNRPASGNLD